MLPLRLQIGRSFTPIDALGMGVKAVLMQDALKATDRIVGWLDSKSTAKRLP